MPPLAQKTRTIKDLVKTIQDRVLTGHSGKRLMERLEQTSQDVVVMAERVANDLRATDSTITEEQALEAAAALVNTVIGNAIKERSSRTGGLRRI